MPTASYDIVCEQGGTLELRLQWLDPNEVVQPLAGYAVEMHVRKTAKSTTPVLTLSTSLGNIQVDEEDTITILVPASRTARLVPGGYVYDIAVRSTAGRVTYLLKGRFVVQATVTRL